MQNLCKSVRNKLNVVQLENRKSKIILIKLTLPTALRSALRLESGLER